MIEKQIARLERLDREVAQINKTRSSSTSQGSGTKRAGMQASYRSWKVASSRPVSDRGVTFHFKHGFVTKGKHVSQSWQDQTTAGKHQGYIERAGAVEAYQGFTPSLEPSGESPSVVPDKRMKAAVEEGKIEEPTLAFPAPEITPGRLSFGTTGSSRSQRMEFWRKIEKLEGVKARVQCRIILELPCESTPEMRFHIARDFAKAFEKKGLPYWCAIHAPSGHNDKRNHHLHIAYLDRPARKTPQGQWDFELEYSYKNRFREAKKVRPFRLPKDREAQGKPWVLALRRHYADVANFHLSLAGEEKRYDPRSYQESGVLKQPTRHLGTKSGIAETYGVETRRGTENVRREVDYRLSKGSSLKRAQEAERQLVSKRLEALWEQDPSFEPLHKRAQQALQEHAKKSQEQVQALQQEEAHRIAAEAVLLRLTQRESFLAKESERLLTRSPSKGEEKAAWEMAEQLLRERELAKATRPEMEAFAASALATAAHFSTTAQKANEDGQQALKSAIEQEQNVMALMAQKSGTPEIDVKQHAVLADLSGRITRTMALIDTGVAKPPLPPVEDAKAPTASKAETPLVQDTRTPEQKALDALLGGTAVKRDTPLSSDRAFILSVQPSPKELQSFLKIIQPLSNRDFRIKALSTRDAADLEEDMHTRRQHLAAWEACREIARRRGLDLDTGIYNPQQALDAEEAKRHQDNAQKPEEQRRTIGAQGARDVNVR